jgi:hypothetical protein
MIFHGSLPKYKKKKPPKAVREQYDQWLLKHSPNKTIKPVNTTKWSYNLSTPVGRETVRHPSLDTGLGVATKPVRPETYTGNNIKGIATMHKSNAVPVFSNEEAVDISKMRR